MHRIGEGSTSGPLDDWGRARFSVDNLWFWFRLSLSVCGKTVPFAAQDIFSDPAFGGTALRSALTVPGKNIFALMAPQKSFSANCQRVIPMGHTFIQIPQVCPAGGVALRPVLLEGPPDFPDAAISLKYSRV